MSNQLPAWYHNNQLIPPTDSSDQLEKDEIDKIYQNYMHEVFALNSSTFISDSNSEPPSYSQLDILENNLDNLLQMFDSSRSDASSLSTDSFSSKYHLAEDFIAKYS
jgi:hypothetical protein